MQIFVRTLTGKTLTIEAEPSDTIARTKEKVAEKVGWNDENARLLYNGLELRDWKYADGKYSRGCRSSALRWLPRKSYSPNGRIVRGPKRICTLSTYRVPKEATLQLLLRLLSCKGSCNHANH
jgi:hypothetical protein